MRRVVFGSLAALFVACGTSSPPSDTSDGGSAGNDAGGSSDGSNDGTVISDGGNPTDGGTTHDGSTPSDGATGVVSCTGTVSIAAAWPIDPALTPSSIATDAQGNIYLAGLLKGTGSFGTTMLTATGNVDFFLAMMNASGQPQWAYHYGSTNTFEDAGPLLAVDAAGDVFMAGFFSGSLHFGGTAPALTAIAVDAFAARFTSSGTGVWADRFGFDQGPYAITSIALDAHGDVMVGGTAGGTIVLGTTTWNAPDPPASGDSQAFIAKLYASDGSVAWSNASGGTLIADSALVTVDAAGRSALAMRVEGGSSVWGEVPEPDGGAFLTQRVGFDATGAATWSHFDVGAFPEAATTDEAGRISIVENSFGAWSTDGASFPDVGEVTIALLFDPNDGSYLSGAEAQPTFPWVGTSAPNGFTFASGQFQSSSASFGSITVPSPGAYALYVAELDPTSHFVSAIGFGGGNTQPTALGATPNGDVLVAGTTETAFTTSGASIPVGSFVVEIAPPVCANDLGPAVTQGDGGDLLDGAPPESDASPAMCPASQSAAVNGAACPVDMGCSYAGSTCCFCQPTACAGHPTTWVCNTLPTQNAACPATPPSPGDACPSGVDCNYCLSGGRFFADCTAGGWETGYAQIVCQ